MVERRTVNAEVESSSLSSYPMCKHGTDVILYLPIAANLSHTGKKYYRNVAVDKCISDIILALNSNGLETLASCCGHGKNDGQIFLMDGRELIIRV